MGLVESRRVVVVVGSSQEEMEKEIGCKMNNEMRYRRVLGIDHRLEGLDQLPQPVLQEQRHPLQQQPEEEAGKLLAR